MRAIGKLNDTFGVYAAYLDVIADTAKQCDRATLQLPWSTKLTEANVLPRSKFLSDLLLPAKTLSLATQNENTDIITIVNLVWITHKKYIKLETNLLFTPWKCQH